MSLCCTLSTGRFSGGDIMSKANSKAATKRNNRKIHARKFLATPEGKSWLERKTIEEAEMKLVSEARKFI